MSTKPYHRLHRVLPLILACFSTLSFCPVPDWGFHGHRKINELAINTLPEGLFQFYKSNRLFLIDHAVDPDKRRYSVIGEAERHFIDIDHYCDHHDTLCNPFDNMPQQWNEAVAQYSEDTLRAYGIVPWHIEKMVHQLTRAFEEKNTKRILRLSTELGHYIGDAHVPLHTTENYNGQLTNQVGIHGFWESRIPELFDGNYDFFTGQAQYIDNPLEHIWSVVEESHNGLDSVLTFERELSMNWSEESKYSYEERGRALMRVYSEEYSEAYHNMLDGQVERRMRQAVLCLGSFWYTAWVNAGQPVLNKIDPIDVDLLENEIAKDNKQEEIQELKTRVHEN